MPKTTNVPDALVLLEQIGYDLSKRLKQSTLTSVCEWLIQQLAQRSTHQARAVTQTKSAVTLCCSLHYNTPYIKVLHPTRHKK